MRISGFVLRIIQQLMRDKRTLALMFLAPILIMTMLSLVFDTNDYEAKVAVVHISEPLQSKLDVSEFKVYANKEKALADIKNGSLDGYVSFKNPAEPEVVVEGSDPSINGAVMKKVQTLFPSPSTDFSDRIEYVYGSKEMGMFDSFGPVLLGFFVFFFVFLVSGVSFLRERTTGTLERLLVSPIKIWEMVMSYVIGFGFVTLLQASLISWYSIYVLDMMMKGSFFYVLIIIVSLSFTALTLGILLSAFAKNELQMMQFIPIVVIPQIFFSGLFNLETISEWLSWVGPITPLYYAADALRDVMIRGFAFEDILFPFSMLIGFSLLFILLNVAALKKYRKI
ncbi:ABC-2 type transport system permease protein [Bacillus ectoiniformans]|uniref:ABC transporter permease n=1 Tax=Bacillus ectoiniformans TaxID=1494429 RepID=UPI00195AD712|nr:ABC transporter permease [Bacillus ectoiniformans]MBM7648464.1 ABC-2 type transport system permease protein [Bacillus ectoiniformans]